MEITFGETAAACGGELLRGSGKAEARFVQICTDTRSINPGDLFAAIKGVNHDGHAFLEDAFRKGAAGALLESYPEDAPPGAVIIRVPSTVGALGNIASFYRKKFSIPFVGVTGSSGKTTVREMLYSILSRKYSVLRSIKNFNNEIGLPLTIFRLDSSHEACVLEMGMSAPGEIRALCEIAKPDAGVITNIGLSHFAGFGSADDIALAKAEILEDLAMAALNIDDPYYSFLRERAAGEVRTFGLGNEADFRAEKIERTDAGCRFTMNSRCEISLPVSGMHNVMNALAASAAASFLGAGEEEFMNGLFDFTPPSMRLELKKINGVQVIDDSYNANPQSVAAAAEVLAGFPGRKIFVLGDMLELGAISRECHEESGRMIAGKGFSMFFAFGSDSRYAAAAAGEAGMENAYFFNSKQELIGKLFDVLEPSDTVLVKGSRGSCMEEVVKAFSDSARGFK